MAAKVAPKFLVATEVSSCPILVAVIYFCIRRKPIAKPLIGSSCMVLGMLRLVSLHSIFGTGMRWIVLKFPVVPGM